MSDLVAAFVARLPPNTPLGADEVAGLPRALDAVIERARAEVPEVELDADVFVAYLADRVSFDVHGRLALDAVRAGDLWIACGCVAGRADAHAAFEVRFAPQVKQALTRGFDAQIAEDAELRLRNRLFLTAPDERARLATYSGRGALAGWLRAAAASTAIDLIRERREVPTENPQQLEEPIVDPLLATLKAGYREHFRDAFSAAAAQLAPRDRTLLRYRFVDDLSIDEIGVLYRVHRATVARWIATVRETLFETTREQLAQRLELPASEIDSVLRLIDSQLDVSIEAVFGSAT